MDCVILGGGGGAERERGGGKREKGGGSFLRSCLGRHLLATHRCGPLSFTSGLDINVTKSDVKCVRVFVRGSPSVSCARDCTWRHYQFRVMERGGGEGGSVLLRYDRVCLLCTVSST